MPIYVGKAQFAYGKARKYLLFAQKSYKMFVCI